MKGAHPIRAPRINPDAPRLSAAELAKIKGILTGQPVAEPPPSKRRRRSAVSEEQRQLNRKKGKAQRAARRKNRGAR